MSYKYLGLSVINRDKLTDNEAHDTDIPGATGPHRTVLCSPLESHHWCTYSLSTGLPTCPIRAVPQGLRLEPDSVQGKYAFNTVPKQRLKFKRMQGALCAATAGDLFG
jgi:hypothetical protein